MNKVKLRILAMMALTVAAFILFKSPAQASPMVDMVFHEARNQPVIGQQLVYRTVKNRAADDRWKANTDEAVINQPYQFSFTLLPSAELLRRSLNEVDVYSNIHELVSDWDSVNLQDPLGFEGVNHYLVCTIADDISWTKKMLFLGQVGDHCFYRW